MIYLYGFLSILVLYVFDFIGGFSPLDNGSVLSESVLFSSFFLWSESS